eukprot:9023372-Alexandrium_andersonii.AAC.1
MCIRDSPGAAHPPGPACGTAAIKANARARLLPVNRKHSRRVISYDWVARPAAVCQGEGGAAATTAGAPFNRPTAARPPAGCGQASSGPGHVAGAGAWPAGRRGGGPNSRDGLSGRA